MKSYNSNNTNNTNNTNNNKSLQNNLMSSNLSHFQNLKKRLSSSSIYQSSNISHTLLNNANTNNINNPLISSMNLCKRKSINVVSSIGSGSCTDTGNG